MRIVWWREDFVQERNGFVAEGNFGRKMFDEQVVRTCATPDVVLSSMSAWSSRQTAREKAMTWKTPKIVEVPVGMEINMYACAARK
jgi:coenzyme PQQ precursor peptide PqqA